MACSWQFWWCSSKVLPWKERDLYEQPLPWSLDRLDSFDFSMVFSYRIVTSRRRRQDICAERGTSGATYGPECSRSGFHDGWLGWVLMGMDGWWSEEKVWCYSSHGISYCHLPSLVISHPQIGYTVAFCRRFHWPKLLHDGSLKTFEIPTFDWWVADLLEEVTKYTEHFPQISVWQGLCPIFNVLILASIGSFSCHVSRRKSGHPWALRPSLDLKVMSFIPAMLSS